MQGGERLSTSVDGKGTGEGADIRVMDDPNSTMDAVSQQRRMTALAWHDTVFASRVTDPKTACTLYIHATSP